VPAGSFDDVRYNRATFPEKGGVGASGMNTRRIIARSHAACRLQNSVVLITIACWVGSLCMMAITGHRNPSTVLLGMFALWVSLPFLALLWASGRSYPWPSRVRTALYVMMVVVSVASLAIYGRVAFGPPAGPPARAFLLVPPASCLVSAVVLLVAGMTARGGRPRP
jgi:hypothetical protein